jgi:hypothetical protein
LADAGIDLNSYNINPNLKHIVQIGSPAEIGPIAKLFGSAPGSVKNQAAESVSALVSASRSNFARAGIGI